MEKSNIIIYVFLGIFLAFRLYQKFGKKKQADSGKGTKVPAGNDITGSNDDDYEPYSKKQ